MGEVWFWHEESIDHLRYLCMTERNGNIGHFGIGEWAAGNFVLRMFLSMHASLADSAAKSTGHELPPARFGGLEGGVAPNRDVTISRCLAVGCRGSEVNIQLPSAPPTAGSVCLILPCVRKFNETSKHHHHLRLYESAS